MRRFGMLLAALAVFGSAFAKDTTQVVDSIHAFEGPSFGSRFGHAAGSAGDVDGDGATDIIVGAPFGDIAAGNAWVYSGADGSELLQLDPPTEGGIRFGASVAGIGDVDGDGHDDLLVGAPGADPDGLKNAGSAWILSGTDGSILAALHGDAEHQRFGCVVASAGDVDADGTPDVIVGTAGDGGASVFSGLDGQRLHHLVGEAGDRFGIAVSGAGDLDDDGAADLIIGADQAPSGGRGYAAVHSGRTGLRLFTFRGEEPGDNFGGSVASAGDVNRDGTPDLVVGSGTHDDHRAMGTFGRTRVFSGRDGSPIHELPWRSAFVSAAGDLDEDGHADVLVGTPAESSEVGDAGRVRVISGRDGSTLATLDGNASGERFGVSVGGACDVDGDGRTDIIVGADDLLTQLPPRGSVKVLSLPAPSGGGASAAPATDIQS